MSRKKNSLAFEDALTELEQLITKMEQGDISPAQARESLARGAQLSRTCQKALQAAEQKVNILLAQNGQHSLEPFTDD